MTTNDQGSRGAAVTSADQIGKVFIVVGQRAQCLICEQFLTRRASAEPAKVVFLSRLIVSGVIQVTEKHRAFRLIII
jgi:hypothetical protein